MADGTNEDKYLKMIYKPNENKKEKQEIIKKLKETYFPLEDEKDFKEEIIRIFDKYFVEQNGNKCKIIYNNKKYKLKEYFNEIDTNYSHNINEIKLKIIGINNITNMKDMFHGCFYLSSVSESNIENIQKYICKSYDNFTKAYSLLYEETRIKNINEVNNIDVDNNYELKKKYKEESIDLYYGYYLSSFDNISLYKELSLNNNKIRNVRRMFSGCISLQSLPDLSKWDTSNIIDMGLMFDKCYSLITLPDISKWNTSKVSDMIAIFQECNSLKSLPDI